MIGRGFAINGIDSSINDRSSNASVTSSMRERSMLLKACSRYRTPVSILESFSSFVFHIINTAVDELGAAGGSASSEIVALN